jgi:nitroreductase
MNSLLILLKKLKKKISKISLSLNNQSRFLSDFYYFLFSNKFSNEHISVLKGRKEYHKSLKDIGETSYLLRRNVHRLEKGLIMKPRRKIFAKSYILETVKIFKKSLNSKIIDKYEIKWAKDVLNEYFLVVGDDQEIEIAKNIFIKSIVTLQDNADFVINKKINNSYIPYIHEKLPNVDFTFEDLKKLYLKRRSVRWYQQKEVDFELITKAVEIASFAPSACNRQAYKFLFCNKKDITTKIAKCADGTSGYAENIPSIIIVIGDLSAYEYEKDRHLIYIDSSLASMQLMLALVTLGLSTCPINWPDLKLNEKKLRKIIKLKDHEKIIMFISVGYPDVKSYIPFSQKKKSKYLLKKINDYRD